MFSFLLPIIYITFISLGLPDSLLGSAWPTMYIQFGVPISYAGIIAGIIAACTVVSSLLNEQLSYRLGTGRVTALSVALTAGALLGFSLSRSFGVLCLLAVPYGLGAGSVDASLNNYVAVHYASRHMSWLHCMWGVGASTGPFILSAAIAGGNGWSGGYRYIAIIQAVLTMIILLSLPLWKGGDAKTGSADKPLSIAEILRIPGAPEVMLCFFCYCAVEQTAGLWASSYLVLHHGVDPSAAASLASLFFIGITVGRAVNGFLTFKFSDDFLIRLGESMIAAGILLLLLPLGRVCAFVGFIIIGLGCAPVYPCVIHSTPSHFGERRSHSIIGMQMASAYVGTCLMPPLLGFLTQLVGSWLLPYYLLIILALMAVMHERLVKKTARGPTEDLA